MKRMVVVFVVLLSVVFVSNTQAQKDRKLSNGFSINAVMGIPSAEYGMAKDDEVDSEYALGSLYGLQLGNRWYFSPSETFGIGLMVNWADMTFAFKGGTDESGTDWGRAAMDLTFIELGPVGTIALTDDIALDGYYNLRPTLFSSAFVMMDLTNDEEETFAYAGFGFSHAIGAAFRWKALNIGVEYVLGSINSVGAYTGSYDYELGDKKNQTNSLRMMLGVKF